MSAFPVAVSLVASHLSGITLLGMPAEVYTSGIQISACVISAMLVTLATIYVYLPPFAKLQVISSNEYLESRFDSRTRSFASFLYIISNMLLIPIVIYVPCLGLNQMTGMKLYYLAPALCLVCIFYTTIGGLKAVVVTDTLQFCVTFTTVTTILILGTYYSGLANIWEKAKSSGRLDFFNMSLDPTERTTFWGITIGLTFIWITNIGANPSSIQRYLALPTYQAARRCIFLFGLGVAITKSVSIFTGLIIYAKYSDCDLISTKQIKRTDQLLPYYVLDITRNLPGLPGLFIAGIFSTALSTMSTNLNSLACIVYQDFIKPRMSNDTNEKTINTIMKTIVVVCGALALLIVLIVEKLGGVLQLAFSLDGIAKGPMLGLFTLGMLFPSANAIGAIVGAMVSTLFTSVLVIGSQYYTAMGKIKSINKPLYTYGCEFNVTNELSHTTVNIKPEDNDKPFILFTISFYFFSFIGCLLVVLVGLLVSWITKDKNAPPVNRDLLSPCIYWLLPKENNADTTKYRTVEYDMITVSNNTAKQDGLQEKETN